MINRVLFIQANKTIAWKAFRLRQSKGYGQTFLTLFKNDTWCMIHEGCREFISAVAALCFISFMRELMEREIKNLKNLVPDSKKETIKTVCPMKILLDSEADFIGMYHQQNDWNPK